MGSYRILFLRKNSDRAIFDREFSTLRDINYFLDSNLWMFVHGDVTIIEVAEVKTVTEKNYEDEL